MQNVDIEFITVNLAGPIRREAFNGRKYLVASARLIVPGVLPGSDGPLLYPPEEIVRNYSDWNGMPLVAKNVSGFPRATSTAHPFKDGKPTTARSPVILAAQGVGWWYNTSIDPTTANLDGEAWFDEEDTRRVDSRILTRLEAGQTIEVSSGLGLTKVPAPPGSTHNDGRPFSSVARNYHPDHVAVLIDEIGACSIKDGCGILVNSDGSLYQETYALEFAEAILANELPSASANVTPDKACKILKDGTVHGKPLTDKQRGMFGSICGKRDKSTNSYGGDTMPLTPAQRAEHVTFITTNCECWKDPADLDILNKMTDDKLVKLKSSTETGKKLAAIAGVVTTKFGEDVTNVMAVNAEGGYEALMKKCKDVMKPTGNETPTVPPPPPVPVTPTSNFGVEDVKKVLNALTPAERQLFYSPEDRAALSHSRAIVQREFDGVVAQLKAIVANTTDAKKKMVIEHELAANTTPDKLENLVKTLVLVSGTEGTPTPTSNNQPSLLFGLMGGPTPQQSQGRVVYNESANLETPDMEYKDDKINAAMRRSG